ncbi:MAG TPA: hypothetical protein VIE90_11065 [Candidatus Binatia bacterium]|jgi:hypothetical protein
MIRFIQTLILALCAFHTAAFAGADVITDDAGIVEPVSNAFAHGDGVLKNFEPSAKKTFSLDFGPELIQLKGLYLEKHSQDSAPIEFLDPPSSPALGRYFDLFATSSQFGGKLVGESELAYSTLGLPAAPQDQPIMTRLGLKGIWGKVGYGLSYRSFDAGFVSTTGTKVEHARDEKQLWTEYDLGLFRVRGVTGETSEENKLTNSLTLTKSAGTSVHLNKAKWSASLSSTYSVIGEEEAIGQNAAGWTHGLLLVFRPAGFFTIEPKLDFRKEWDGISGLETNTPSAALMLSTAPSRNFRWVGRASYAKGVSDDPLKDAATLHTGTSLNWSIGRSFFGEQSLAIQFDYRTESRPDLPESSLANLTGMIHFKVAGF